MFTAFVLFFGKILILETLMLSTILFYKRFLFKEYNKCVLFRKEIKESKKVILGIENLIHEVDSLKRLNEFYIAKNEILEKKIQNGVTLKEFIFQFKK